MITLHSSGVFLSEGVPCETASVSPEEGRRRTLSWSILQSHNRSGDENKLRLRFDAMVSHDITYVGILQQARASGMREFPLPYALTNCHNSLCAVGGTINGDDHAFGLSAAKKYGGIYVPANQSVIHSYAREQLAGCGKMILGSDSHTRYGALGTMGVGEGGPELCKQLLKDTWDGDYPEIVLVWLTGAPKPGVGPHDVALALIKATFEQGFVRNRVLEFAGPGIASLPMDYRNGVDVMTTETACLSSVWETDDTVQKFYEAHGRAGEYRPLSPGEGAYYDRMVSIDLDAVEPMLALPFHPSNAYPIREFLDNAADILAAVEADAKQRWPKASPRLLDKIHDGGVWADQGIVAGCAGGLFDNITATADILAAVEADAKQRWPKASPRLLDKIHDGGVWADQGIVASCAGGLFDNITATADILRGGAENGDFSLSVYPTSVPVSLALTRAGISAALLEAGAVLKPSFCGPCFGAGDVPANNALSLRHTTRNFPNREGSKPGEGQFAAVCLMDARSIAATARNGGRITPATEETFTLHPLPYAFDPAPYEKRVYNGVGRPLPETELVMGPNITDWPVIQPPAENLLVELAAVLRDEVTTTDELIPSGETSSYRSNPLRLAEFTLSRREPQYVPRAKAIAAEETARLAGTPSEKLVSLLNRVGDGAALLRTTQFGSAIYANRPGDGSAREQAASCQRVLGGCANLCQSFATKRYRSNCINWGIFPFTMDMDFPGEDGACVFIPGVRNALANHQEALSAVLLRRDGTSVPLTLHLQDLTGEEREILLDGCLMNYYRKKNG